MTNERQTVYLVLPVFNDFESLSHLVDSFIKLSNSFQIHLVVVDDCSSVIFAEIEQQIKFKCSQNGIKISIHKLSINRGNQFAIWIGLHSLRQTLKPNDRIVVMDSDGEDNPDSIPLLLNSHSMGTPTVAQRGKRSSSISFKIWHFFYKKIFNYFTQKNLDFGNFSVIDSEILEKLLSNEKTNYMGYPGSLLSTNFAIKRIRIDKLPRSHGRSRTNLSKLIQWGLLQMSPFTDAIFSQTLKFSIKFIVFTIAVSIFLVFLRLMNFFVVPGWTSLILFFAFISSVLITIFTSMILSLFFIISGMKVELRMYSQMHYQSLTHFKIFLDKDS